MKPAVPNGKIDTDDQCRPRTSAMVINGQHAQVVGPDGAVSRVEGMSCGSALLVVKRGPNAGSRLLLDRPVSSAGRNHDSDIFLDDATVSRRHAEFQLENGEFRVVDLGSLNGTCVNREPVDSAVLANGDEVQIGNFRLVFLSGLAPDAPNGYRAAS